MNSRLNWRAMGISGTASFLDLAGTAVIVSFLFLLGPQGLFVEIRGGAVLVLPFMMLWTGKWHRRAGCLTGAEWNIHRFGDCWGGRAAQLTGVIATVLTTNVMLAYLIIGAGLLVPTLPRLYWWRFNGSGSAIGTLVGIAAAIIQRLLWPEPNEVWQFIFVLTVGFVSSVAVALLPGPEVLRKMYLETRPFGVWGHLKKSLTPKERAKRSREHRNDLLSLPFALVWQTTLFLAPMLFIIRNRTGFAGATLIGLGAFAGAYLVWYRNLPETNLYQPVSAGVKSMNHGSRP